MTLDHITAARPTAATTFDASVVLATVGADTWNDAADQLAEGAPVEVWTGPASIGPPRGSTPDAGHPRGTNETIDTRVLRLPADAPVAVGQRAYIVAECETPDLDEANCYVITRVDDRTTSVIQRARIVSLSDHRTVPR